MTGKERKKPISAREAELRAVYDNENIQLATHEFHWAGERHEYKYDSEHKSELSEFERLRGGRPREDVAAAMADALRNEGKKWNEVSELLQQKTGEFRTADNCRKLVTAWHNRKKRR